jgi:outer membrane protein assembly factor BamB
MAVSALAAVALSLPAAIGPAGPAASTTATTAAATTTTATTTTATTTTAGAGAGAGTWTVYHHDPAGSGLVTGVSAVDTGARAWTSPALDGQLYGEPLVTGGRVYVATENDTVYALSVSTGAVVWSKHLATPVPASDLPCGDIQPTVGITGTPVIDTARGEIFVVADEAVHGHPSHVLVGLNTASGATELTQDVDPAGADPAALLQRTGLTLTSGRVVFGFGGNYGDCSTYRGWVVGVDESGGTPVDFGVDTGAGQSQGAVWMGGAAPAVDASGNVWVGVGNGSVTSASRPYDYSDSVLELSPALQLEQYFAPSSWPSDNASDFDLSMAPALLSDGQVVIAGKARIAYLLNGARLGGIGGQKASLGSICRDDVDGGSAQVGSVVYLPCLSGIVAVRAGASPPSLRTVWSSGAGGGPPIVAAGLVWTIGQDGTLSGLDPSTGTVRQRATIGAPANHFPTPSIGDGLLLAPSAEHVVAFTASSSAASSTTGPASTTSVPQHSPARSGHGSGLSTGAVAGIVVVVVAVVGGAAWLVWRRRRSRRLRDQ